MRNFFINTSETKMTACKPFDLDDHSENYGGCEESIARSSEVIYDKKKKLPKKHYLSHLETIEIVLSYTIQQNVCNLYRANQEIYTVGLFE